MNSGKQANVGQVRGGKVISETRAGGKITSSVQVGNNVMVRRRYDEAALKNIVDNGLMSPDQAKQANQIGRSQVDRALEIAGAGALMGADQKVISDAIDSDLTSNNRTGIENNPVLIDHTKKALGLPNLRGANVKDLVAGAGELDVAGADRGNANNWRDLNAAQLGKISASDYLTRIGSRNGDDQQPQGGSGGQDQGAADATGSGDAAAGSGTGADQPGGFGGRS